MCLRPTQDYLGCTRSTVWIAITYSMFKAIGTVIVLYAIANMMTPAFDSFQAATVATFGAIETAAEVTTKQLEAEMQNP